MKPYIEKRDGSLIEFNSLTRKQRIELQKEISKVEDNKDIEFVENLVYKLLTFNNELTKEEFDDILDYNAEVYGFNETYEMLGYIIEDVFTQVGGENLKKENPYLQHKRETHQR